MKRTDILIILASLLFFTGVDLKAQENITVPEGYEPVNFYEPGWNDPDEKLIVQSGHGGADFLLLKSSLPLNRLPFL